ncbi:MAG: DUF2007 domain-containing protein [Akkermansiaceae bacterium]
METVSRFIRGEDAYLFRSFLDANGIEAFVFDEYVPQLFWHYTQAIGGVRVAVADQDLEPARALYTEYQEALQDGPPVTEDVRAWPFVLLISFIVGLPVMLFGRKAFSNDDGNS